MTKDESLQLRRKKKAARAAYKTIMSDARVALAENRANPVVCVDGAPPSK
jgi:hypothetical protein